MTFEEFFKKKKIDLAQLSTAEPALFAEFEAHYAAMGEKSFDHTKKYWFNNLRRLYHTPEEVKAEKVQIENQIAEQTVIDSVTNEVPEVLAPKLGFKPKFRAGVTAAADKPATLSEEEPKAEEHTESQAPKLGFKPKFKTAITKPVENELPATLQTQTEETAPETVPKLGFKPKFKAGVTKPAESIISEQAEEIKSEEQAVATPPKLGFKPKFKAGITKPAQIATTLPVEETKPEEPATTPAPKLGFKPKFKPKTE